MLRISTLNDVDLDWRREFPPLSERPHAWIPRDVVRMKSRSPEIRALLSERVHPTPEPHDLVL